MPKEDVLIGAGACALADCVEGVADTLRYIPGIGLSVFVLRFQNGLRSPSAKYPLGKLCSAGLPLVLDAAEISAEFVRLSAGSIGVFV